MSPQFHLMHDGDFQTVTSFKKNLHPNWRRFFEIEYCNGNSSFRSPLEAKVDDKKLKAKVRLNDNVSNDVSHANPSPSTDNNDDIVRAVPLVLEGENSVPDGHMPL